MLPDSYLYCMKQANRQLELHLQSGKWAEAEELLETLSLPEGELHFWRGFLQTRQEKHEKALLHMNAALTWFSDDADILCERAVIYFHLHRKRESLEDLNQAVRLDPANSFRYSSRAYIRDAMGDTDGAIEDYEMAIALDPQDGIAHNNLGLLLEKKGYKDKAQPFYDIADALAGDLEPQTEEKKAEASPDETEESQETTAGIMRKIITDRKVFHEFTAFWRERVKDWFRKRK